MSQSQPINEKAQSKSPFKHKRASDSSYELTPHLLVFLKDYPFFAELSRHVRKVPTYRLPTAGVSFNVKTEDLELGYNPDFMKKLSVSETRGVLMHEFYHIVFKHITARVRKPHKLWNWATDLAINSLITEKETPNQGERMLPHDCLVPGVEWRSPETLALGPNPLYDFVLTLPKMLSSENYFELLNQSDVPKPSDEDEQGGQCDGNCQPDDGSGGKPCDGSCKCNKEPKVGSEGEGTMDSHGWENIPEDKRAIADNVIDGILRKAVHAADSSSNGWGSIPTELRDAIRRSVQGYVNWRNVLRQFVGKLIRGYKSTSFKRINRRFPYMHPGAKVGHVAKLIVFRDESGSVGNDMLAEFTAELFSLTKKVQIDFCPFDCQCSEDDIVPWLKGRVPEAGLTRTKDGGTDFDAPTRIFNDPKNRGRWDGMLIFTDGGAPEPEACRGKRGWIIPKGLQLAFKSEELQVFIDKEQRTEDSVTH
jgi:predicted metal-dependent peptidase